MSGDRELIILYASETGTAEDLAFKIWNEAKCVKKVPCIVMNILDFPPERLLEPGVSAMFIIATSGDGEIVSDMKEFWKFFLRKKMGPSSLMNLSMSIFGLGDSSYEKYNASARKFSVRLLQLGAKEFVPLGLGDDQAGYGYNSALYPWLAGFWHACETAGMIQPHAPTSQVEGEESPAGASAGISVDGYYRVRLLGGVGLGLSVEAAPAGEAVSPVDPARLQTLLCEAHCAAGIVSAEVASSARATGSEWAQDVRLLELLLPTPTGDGSPPLSFLGGDVAKLYPANSDKVVERLLSRISAAALVPLIGPDSLPLTMEAAAALLLHIEAAEDCPVRKTRLLGLANRDRRGSGGAGAGSESIQCSLLELLRHLLDIQGVPKPSFFQVCATYATEPVEREKLLEMGSAEGTDLYYDYCIQEHRNFVEVLEEFPSVSLDLSRLCAIVPLLLPREFSVASSVAATKNNMNLCIGLVKFRTKYNRQRTGTCSRFVECVRAGDRVCVSLTRGAFSGVYSKHNTLGTCPPEIVLSPWSSSSLDGVGSSLLRLQLPALPVILVGPGTGIAPMRAIVQERVAVRDAHSYTGQTWAAHDGLHTLVFYGCRKFHEDCLYRSEWSDFPNDMPTAIDGADAALLPPPPPQLATQSHASGVFVSVAFSQEEVQGQLIPSPVASHDQCSIPPTGKVYVTHKIRLHSAAVWSLLQQGAVIFIAGSAGKRMPSNVKNAILNVIQHHQGGSAQEAAQYFKERFESKGKFLVEAWS